MNVAPEQQVYYKSFSLKNQSSTIESKAPYTTQFTSTLTKDLKTTLDYLYDTPQQLLQRDNNKELFKHTKINFLSFKTHQKQLDQRSQVHSQRRQSREISNDQKYFGIRFKQQVQSSMSSIKGVGEDQQSQKDQSTGLANVSSTLTSRPIFYPTIKFKVKSQ